MPAVAALVLTLALAPAPSPSPPSGPVGDILGGVGRVVDGVLGGHGTPSATPTASVTPTATSTPSPPPVTGQPNPAAPGATAAPAGASAGVRGPATPDRPAGGSGTDAQDAAVPQRTGDTPASEVPPALASPARDGWPPVSYLLVAAVLAVLALLLLRRRAPGTSAAPTPDPAPQRNPDPQPDPAPQPDPDPGPDNVRRLPTSLNDIYELGRLDERLEQERRRGT